MPSPAVSYTFSNSTTADATQVNQNFTDVINGLTDGTKDLSINALTCAGTATLNGNVNLGNSSSDDLTVTASLASTISIKTTYSYDIGSTTIGLRKIFLGASDSAARSVNLSAGAVSASYGIVFPTAAPSASGMVSAYSSAGVMTFESRLTYLKAAKTTTYTATTSDEVITCDTTTAAWTLTLPAAASSTNKVLKIIRIDATVANALTIDGDGSETINGATTFKLLHQYESVTLWCDGSNWLIVERSVPTYLGNETWTDGQANATTSVYLSRRGKLVKVVGKTSFTGAAGSDLDITIPAFYTPDATIYASPSASQSYVFGHAVLNDNGTGRRSGVCSFIQTGSFRINIISNSTTYDSEAAITATEPHTWASGDTVTFEVEWFVSNWEG